MQIARAITVYAAKFVFAVQASNLHGGCFKRVNFVVAREKRPKQSFDNNNHFLDCFSARRIAVTRAFETASFLNFLN